MSRTLLVVAFAGGILWASASHAPAQDSRPGVSPQTQKINELIAKGWESQGIKKPANRASDLEFMRRAFIDLIGRIPTPEEIVDFERDNSSNRRARLVNRLLTEEKYIPRGSTGKSLTAIAGLKSFPINYNNAYAENFADLWTNWMLTRSNTHPLYRKQFTTYLAQQFAYGTPDSPNANGKAMEQDRLRTDQCEWSEGTRTEQSFS